MSYRPSPKEAKVLLKKSDKNMLPTIFTPEQVAILQPMLDRLDKLEKLVAKQKKSLAEMKGQYNKMFGGHLTKQLERAGRVLGGETGRKSPDGVNRPVAGDDKGE